MRDERAEEHPRADVVGGVEAEAEHVVVLDVQQPGDDLEEDPADEQQQRQAFERLRGRADRWPGEQLRRDRPQLRQHDRDQDQPEPDVQALGEPVQPRRRRGPVEPRQVQDADITRDRLPELRPVGHVAEQARDDHDGQRREQDDAEYRGEPRSTEGAAEPGQRRAVTLQRPDGRIPWRPPRRRGSVLSGLGAGHEPTVGPRATTGPALALTVR